MKNRFLFTLLLVGAIFYTPWWAVGVLACVVAFFFSPYYEIILLGLLFDVLYGSIEMTLAGTLGLISSIIIFYFGIYLKKVIR